MTPSDDENAPGSVTLGPGLLVASPQMQDPFFTGTVVLLCRHEADGAMGVVINRLTDLQLKTVLDDLEFQNDTAANKEVMWGGPVEPARGTIVLRRGLVESAELLAISPEVEVSGSLEVLKTLIGEPDREPHWFLSLGYAGWGPGQLDEEIHAGSWILCPLDAATVFDLPIHERYDRCISTLGVDASLIFMTPVDE